MCSEQTDQTSTAKNPWSPATSTADIVVCYTYAAWKSNLRAAGLAWIFTDHNGTKISRGSCYQDNVSSPPPRRSPSNPICAHPSFFPQPQPNLAPFRFSRVRHSHQHESTIDGTLLSPSGCGIAYLVCFLLCFRSFISRRFNGPADSFAKVCLCSNSITGL